MENRHFGETYMPVKGSGGMKNRVDAWKSNLKDHINQEEAMESGATAEATL